MAIWGIVLLSLKVHYLYVNWWHRTKRDYFYYLDNEPAFITYKSLKAEAIDKAKA